MTFQITDKLSCEYILIAHKLVSPMKKFCSGGLRNPGMVMEKFFCYFKTSWASSRSSCFFLQFQEIIK